jgi:RNA polymerase primary sigma factor
LRCSGVSLYLRQIRATLPNAGGEGHTDLVSANLRFVVKIAGEYRSMGLPFEDLLNEGNLGLIEAARRFDPARGFKFTTYATFWIRKSIRKAISRNASIVRIPEYQAMQAREVRETRGRLARELGREPNREEISRRLGLAVAHIDRLLQQQLRELSLDDKVGEDQDTTVLDKMADNRSPGAEEALIGRQNRTLLRQAMRSLSRQQLSIIVERFGLRSGRARTLREIGAKLGMSGENVRQIENQARERLRKAMLRCATVRRPDRASTAAAGPIPG